MSRSPAMMYLALEEGPTPVFNPKDCVWENENLIKLFESEIVANYLRQSWVYEEVKAGYPIEKIVEEIWQKEYEEWAHNYLKEMRIEYFEGYED